MREMPANRLNPKIKNVWRINDAIWIALCFLLCFVPFAIVAAVEPDAGWSLVVLGVIAVLFAVSPSCSWWCCPRCATLAGVTRYRRITWR